jgi:hypothetical protein
VLMCLAHHSRMCKTVLLLLVLLLLLRGVHRLHTPALPR